MPTYLNNLYNLAGNGFVLMPMYLNNLYNLAGNGFVLMPMNLKPVFLDCPFLIAPSVFSNVYFPASLDRPFLIAPSVFSNVFFLCQFLWIVLS
jgi:hypothetical protein